MQRAASSKLRIIVTGYVLRLPLAGNAWCYLQYVVGLAALGHDVYYVEESGDSPHCCYDINRNTSGTDPSSGARFTQEALDRFGLGGRWAYWDAHSQQWIGPSADRILEICASADILLRMPAMADSLKPWFEDIPVRVLVDHDPVFTQVRHLTDPGALNDAQGYTAYFSFGENIVRGSAAVPDDGLPWRATRPPVALDSWPVTPGPEGGRFTTVLKWEAYSEVTYDGVGYGLKAASFGPYRGLPSLVSQPLELAVGGGDTPVAQLQAEGWSVRDPVALSIGLDSYRNYIRSSKAEFSVAKQGYVASHSGWLSERSGNYLASGRPVLVQDTGFSDWLECGEGIVAFSSLEEAVAGIEDIAVRYSDHCRAAREVAVEYFDSRRVLPRLLEEAFDLTATPLR